MLGAEGKVSHARPRKHQQPVPVANKFLFTDRELGAIQKGILVSTRAMAYHRWGAYAYRHYGWDIKTQRYNQRVSRNAIRAVHTGVPTRIFTEPALVQVYTAAHAAYNNARLLKCDDQTARRRAVVIAQMVLEFTTGIFQRMGDSESDHCSECGGPA